MEPLEEPEDRLGMTEEQWEWFKHFTRGYGDQDENGDDIWIKKSWEALPPSEQEARINRLKLLCDESRRKAARWRSVSYGRRVG